MVPCFPLSFHPHNQTKLPSFKPFCIPSRHGPFSSSPSPLPFVLDDGAAEDSDLNTHHVFMHTIHAKFMRNSLIGFLSQYTKKIETFAFLHLQVIILEIRQRAMMKARSQPRSSFMIMTAEELGKLIKAAPPPPKANKSDDAEEREKKDGEYEGDDEDEEEFFSVRSCFSRCSTGDEEYGLSRTTAAAVVTLSEEWFGECEGWPFGLWRRRKVVVLPPLPSPADSWTWHKRNLSNVKV